MLILFCKALKFIWGLLISVTDLIKVKNFQCVDKCPTQDVTILICSMQIHSAFTFRILWHIKQGPRHKRLLHDPGVIHSKSSFFLLSALTFVWLSCMQYADKMS